MNPTEAQEMIKDYGVSVVRKTLRSLRERVLLSQQELADLAGVAQQTVSRIEQGQRNLTAPVLARLITVLESKLEKRHKEERRNSISLRALALVRPQEEQTAEALIEEQKRIIEVQRNLIQTQKELIQAYAEECQQLYTEGSDFEKSIIERESRVKELSELLGLETEAALARNKADEFREKIKKPVTAPKGGE